ncbi:hypothetical protein D3C87_1840600 [compost metagenome]
MAAAMADFQALGLASVAMVVRATVAVDFKREAVHRLATAAKAKDVAVILLYHLTDLRGVVLRLEGHKAIQGKAFIQTAVCVITGQQAFLGKVD